MEISILFLPLIASIISGFFGRYIGDRNSEIVTSVLVSASALLSIYVLYQLLPMWRLGMENVCHV